MLSNERILIAQIIGRLENRESGLCTCCIWDVGNQQLMTDVESNVNRIEYRNIGALSLEVVGLRSP